MIQRIACRDAQHQVVLLAAGGAEHAARRSASGRSTARRSAATATHAFRTAYAAESGWNAARIVHPRLALVAEGPRARQAQVQRRHIRTASYISLNDRRARRCQVEAAEAAGVNQASASAA